MYHTSSQVAARLLASVHLAQWEAAQDVLKAKGVSVDAATRDKAHDPDLTVAIASAGVCGGVLVRCVCLSAWGRAGTEVV
jgi:hypothetical protein